MGLRGACVTCQYKRLNLLANKILKNYSFPSVFWKLVFLFHKFFNLNVHLLNLQIVFILNNFTITDEIDSLFR